MTPALLLLVLTQMPDFGPPPSDTQWESAKCRNEGASVVCGKGSFKVLTDTIIDETAKREQCELKLTACTETRDAFKAALLVPQPPPPPKLLVMKPLIALVTGIVGSVALTSALAVDSLSPELRISFGIAGSAAIAGAFTIVFF